MDLGEISDRRLMEPPILPQRHAELKRVSSGVDVTVMSRRSRACATSAVGDDRTTGSRSVTSRFHCLIPAPRFQPIGMRKVNRVSSGVDVTVISPPCACAICDPM